MAESNGTGPKKPLDAERTLMAMSHECNAPYALILRVSDMTLWMACPKCERVLPLAVVVGDLVTGARHELRGQS